MQGKWTSVFQNGLHRRPSDDGFHTRPPRLPDRRIVIGGAVAIAAAVLFFAILPDVPRTTVDYQATHEGCGHRDGTLTYTALGFEIEDDHFESYEITLDAMVITAIVESDSMVVDTNKPGDLKFTVPYDAGVDPFCRITVRGIAS